MALRRWKPFLGAFAHIDAAIEAADADGLLSRDEFRSARGRIVELLCDAGDDGEKAEAPCVLLDEAMAGSLATLREVPAETIIPRVMACVNLTSAIGALATRHGSERVRGLARDVASGWRAGVEARARVAMDLLDGLRSTPPPPPPLQDDTAPAAGTETKQKKEAKIPEEQQPQLKKKTGAVSSRRVCTAESYRTILSKKTAPVVATSKAKPPVNMEAPRAVPAQPKKPPPVALSPAEEQKKMEATKRKLHVAVSVAEEQKKTATVSSCRVSMAESYGPILPKKTAPVVTTSKAKSEASRGVPALPKKPPPIAVNAAEEQKKMEATKRKLHERYQEAEDAKRRRTIQVIKPPACRPTNCAAARRRFMKPSSSLRMGV